mmetsp:Transcript_13404/g.27256  ORF Transcript_13404/g.27256 Transcript_13404/m.27256 type:complete len:262 (-) Transcript_13404:1190-1975(-)
MSSRDDFRYQGFHNETFLFASVLTVGSRASGTRTCLRTIRQTRSPTSQSWDPEDNGFTYIGTVIGEHGVRGEVKVRSMSDFARERLAVTTAVQRFMALAGRLYPRPIELVRGRKASQKSLWIVKFQGYESPEQAKQLRGARIFVRDHERPKTLSHDELLIGEIVGMTCINREGALIGEVSGVITRDELPNAGSIGNDTLEVTLAIPPDSRVLIPFVPSIVINVELTTRCLTLDIPEGLLSTATVPRKKDRRGPRGLLGPCR